MLPDVGKPNDQAARAARCALDVRAELPEVPLVVATGPGRFSAWSVVGEVIDNGMRLLRGTAAGAIRVDDMAVGLLDGRFEIRRDGSASFLRAERDVFEIKRNLLGKAYGLRGPRARDVDALEPVHERDRRVDGVGRARHGRGGRRQITPPAGVRALGRQAARARRGAVRRGSTRWRAGSPFAMIGLCIRRAAGIVEGEPLEERRRKLVERVGRHVDREVVPRVAAFLGEIANVTFPDEQNEALRMARQNPQLMGDGMRRSWEDWLAAECAAHPVLLVLEDLHWGDLGTVSFIDSALRNLREQPFMVLALARPDVDARFPDLWKGRERQIIRLSPLSQRASEKLVREALGAEVSDALVATLVARADGNAFYLEELVRATAAGRHEALPDSVIGMVQARLDAEGGEARVLRAASVFGERFSQAGAAALLGGEGELGHVREWLELLSTRELVARAATAERRGDVEYTFTHALVREAAYAMLTRRRSRARAPARGRVARERGLDERRHGAGRALSPRRGAGARRALVRARGRAGAQGQRPVGRHRARRAGHRVRRHGRGRGRAAPHRGGGARVAWRVRRGGAARARGGRVARAGLGGRAARARLGARERRQAGQARRRRGARAPRERGATGGRRRAARRISCLAWGATYLIFGGRIPAADALMGLVSEVSRGLRDSIRRRRR